MKQKKEPKVKLKKKPERRRQRTKEKSEIYIMRKNTGLKIARCCLWIMLIFFFVKGIWGTLKPDDSAEVTKVIRDFETSFAQYKGENEEMMSFAQNFAKEYLTYQVKGENDYKNRIRPYVSTKVYNTNEITDFKSDAKAIYVQAYKKEQYSVNQWDVYVLAEVVYSVPTEIPNSNTNTGSVSGNSQKEQTTEIKTIAEQTTLKVPIYVNDGNYVVEDMPVFVTDSILLSQYEMIDYAGTTVSDVELSNIKSSLNNFFKAYYEENQSVIEYYLSKDADRSRFYGLNGRYVFQSIETLNAYREDGSQETVCIVELKVKDNANEAVLYQKLHLTIVKDESQKYYINDMNTRTGNIDLIN